MKAVNEWWTEFGEVPGATRSGKLLDPERVDTSGLIYLQQLRARSVRPTVHFSAAVPAAEAAPVQPVTSLPQPNALMPVFAPSASRSLGSASTWLTAMASVVLAVSVGLIAQQTRNAAPAGGPAPEAPVLAAAVDRAPLTPPVAPAPLGPRTVAAVVPVPDRDSATPVAPAPAHPVAGRSRRDHASDEAVVPAPAAEPTSSTSVYDSLAALKPAVAPTPALVAPAPTPVAAPAAKEPRSAAEMLQAAVVGQPTAAPVVEALPVTLPPAQVLARLRTRAGQVTACLRQFGFVRDTVQVRVTITGATGRPSAVQALGPFAGTPAGRCAERSFGGLTLGRFQSASQSVTLPFLVR